MKKLFIILLLAFGCSSPDETYTNIAGHWRISDESGIISGEIEIVKDGKDYYTEVGSTFTVDGVEYETPHRNLFNDFLLTEDVSVSFFNRTVNKDFTKFSYESFSASGIGNVSSKVTFKRL